MCKGLEKAALELSRRNQQKQAEYVSKSKGEYMSEAVGLVGKYISS